MDGMNYAPTFSGITEKVVKEGEFRFSVIGLDHGHIYAMVNGLLEAGADIVGVCDSDEDKAKDFIKRYPSASIMSKEDILNDKSILLVASAIRPDLRASLGLEALKNGKNFFADKPGMITFSELMQVKKEVKKSGLKYMIYFGERVHVEGALYAERLIREGRIGKVVAINIMAPHRLNPSTRPEWFFNKNQNGGILVDIGSHQFEQLLAYTGSKKAEVRYSAKGNKAHPAWPEFEDFGEAVIETESGASCFVRVDWFTPDGLSAWGDGRVFIIGTEGTMEIRKYVNIAADGGKDHVFIVDNNGESHEEATGKIGFPFFGAFIRDILDKTENSIPQERVFESTRLALEADRMAERVGVVNG